MYGNTLINDYAFNYNVPRQAVPFKFKQFVSALPLSSSSCTNAEHSEKHTHIINRESGDSIQNFYVNTCQNVDVNQPSNSHNDENDDVQIYKEVYKKPRKSFTGREYFNHQNTIFKAMRFAQYDEVENLRHLIEMGLSVNTTDEYGWSLLMVASYAGSENVVKYLISKQAKRGKRDTKGNTALYLASKNNFANIVNLLIKNNKDKEEFQKEDSSNNIVIETADAAYFCEVCNFAPSCSVKDHETSIAHLFKFGSTNSRPMYGIPRSNLGFQMLLQQGWNDSEGLGPEGTGRKYPIKAKEKQDRLGIGHSSETSIKYDVPKGKRKTVQRPYSIKMVKQSVKIDKQKERNIRKLLNEPEI